MIFNNNIAIIVYIGKSKSGEDTMHLLFYYNNFEREQRIIQFISDELKRNESDITISYLQADSGIDTLFRIIELNPDIIFTFPITTEYQSVQYSYIKLLINPYIICFSTEGFFILNDNGEFENELGFYDYGENVIDEFIVWGSKPAEIYEKGLKKDGRMKKNDRISYFGYPLYEINRIKDEEDDYIIELIKSNNYERNILVLTGFDSADYDREVILNCEDLIDLKLDPESKEKRIDEIIEQNLNLKEFRSKYVELICKLASRHPEWGFWVKLHPHEIKTRNIFSDKAFDYEKYFALFDNVKVISKNVPISGLLSQSDVLVHYGSTAFMEAYIYEKKDLLLVGRNEKITQRNMTQCCMFVDELDKIEEYLGNDGFISDISIEKFIFEWTNYKKGEKYEPSKKIAEFILNTYHDNKKKKIRLKDIIRVENSGYVSSYRRGILYRMLKNNKLGMFYFAVKMYYYLPFLIKDIFYKIR